MGGIAGVAAGTAVAGCGGRGRGGGDAHGGGGDRAPGTVTPGIRAASRGKNLIARNRKWTELIARERKNSPESRKFVGIEVNSRELPKIAVWRGCISPVGLINIRPVIGRGRRPGWLRLGGLAAAARLFDGTRYFSF